MSVLCCRVPNFLVGLAARQHPEWEGRPLALIGAEGHIWAASPEARQSGVYAQMSARQAQTRCPDVLLCTLDAQQSEAEQGALLGTLAQSGLPVEAQTWGTAYVDLQQVVDQRAHGNLSAERLQRTVRPLCAELGKKIQKLFGETLSPALGWDSSKFTSRAAAGFAKPGHMRLVAHAEETSFLNPLSIQLLPLPWAALQQLAWLGIRTLGQFARLPAAAVGQRFGPAGRIAQQWAQGRDQRPVCANTRSTPEPLILEFEPFTGEYQTALRLCSPRCTRRSMHGPPSSQAAGACGWTCVLPKAAHAPLTAPSWSRSRTAAGCTQRCRIACRHFSGLPS